RRSSSEHDPGKWEPFFGQDHARAKKLQERGGPAVSTMSRWMPPQRVQRMVQYSQPPRPTRPGMIFSTARPPLHCGQADRPGGGGPGIPQPLTRLEGLDVKTVVEAGHLGLRILLQSHENTEPSPGL